MKTASILAILCCTPALAAETSNRVWIICHFHEITAGNEDDVPPTWAPKFQAPCLLFWQRGKAEADRARAEQQRQNEIEDDKELQELYDAGLKP